VVYSWIAIRAKGAVEDRARPNASRILSYLITTITAFWHSGHTALDVHINGGLCSILDPVTEALRGKCTSPGEEVSI
jgi:hypothetical protein